VPGNGVCNIGLYPSRLQFSPDNETLYIGAGSFFNVYHRNSDGSLSFVQRLFEGSGSYIAFSADASSLYAGNVGSNEGRMAVFSRNPGTGALTFVEAEDGEPFPNTFLGPRDIAVSADGTYAYVIANDGIVVLNRNVTDGSLSYKQSYRHGVNGVSGLAQPHEIRLDEGDSRVVVESFTGRLAIFARNSTTGLLTFRGVADSANVTSGSTDDRIIATSDGRTFYRVFLDASRIGVFRYVP
jgi:6-phosphogluconolactonase (cycloisomerase 2 family)